MDNKNEVVSIEELELNDKFRYANSGVVFQLNDRTALTLKVTIVGGHQTSMGHQMGLHRSFCGSDLVIRTLRE